MLLTSVYEEAGAPEVLYALLGEREPYQAISHKTMPTRGEHQSFVGSVPYAAWYLIKVDGEDVGAVYLTHKREVGLFIFKAHQSKGYGSKALALVREKHPGTMYANISVRNPSSKAFFERHGFTHIQNTLVST